MNETVGKEPDYTVIKDARIRCNICRLMSEMLDNPNEHGIYPTARFMSKMETFILSEKNGLKTAVEDFMGYYDPEGGISQVPSGPFRSASEILRVELKEEQRTT